MFRILESDEKFLSVLEKYMFLTSRINIMIIVENIDNKNWLAPFANPIAITKNKKTSSSGSFMAALNLTIDNAPTNPKDNARENLITVITSVVMIASGIKVSEK